MLLLFNKKKLYVTVKKTGTLNHTVFEWNLRQTLINQFYRSWFEKKILLPISVYLLKCSLHMRYKIAIYFNNDCINWCKSPFYKVLCVIDVYVHKEAYVPFWYKV